METQVRLLMSLKRDREVGMETVPALESGLMDVLCMIGWYARRKKYICTQDGAPRAMQPMRKKKRKPGIRGAAIGNWRAAENPPTLLERDSCERDDTPTQGQTLRSPPTKSEIAVGLCRSPAVKEASNFPSLLCDVRIVV